MIGSMIKQILLNWRKGNLVDPRINVNSQVKSKFTDLEREGMLASSKGNRSWYFQRKKVPLKMSIYERDIIEYEMSIELIVKYFKGSINSIKNSKE